MISSWIWMPLKITRNSVQVKANGEKQFTYRKLLSYQKLSEISPRALGGKLVLKNTRKANH